MTQRNLKPTANLLMLGSIVSVIILYEFVFMPKPGFDHNFGYLYGRDFANFWAGGLAVIEGKVAVLTDVTAYNAWLHDLFGGKVGIGTHFIFSYPPNVLPLLVPFALLPYAAALYLYTAVSLALAAVLGWWAAGRERFAGVLLALSPGVMAAIFNGHPGVFLAGLLVGGMLLLERRPVAAGLLLGLATIKPQLGLLIALILLVHLEWKAILAALSSASFLILLSLMLFGLTPWTAYFAHIVPAQVEVLRQVYDARFLYFIPTPFTFFSWLGLPFAWAQGLQAVCSLLVVAATLYVWLRCRDLYARVLTLFIGTALILPYFNNYDLAMLALAQIAFLYRCPASLQLSRPVHVGLWSVAALSPPVAMLGAQVGALPPAAGLIAMVVLARRGVFGYIE